MKQGMQKCKAPCCNFLYFLHTTDSSDHLASKGPAEGAVQTAKTDPVPPAFRTYGKATTRRIPVKNKRFRFCFMQF